MRRKQVANSPPPVGGAGGGVWKLHENSTPSPNPSHQGGGLNVPLNSAQPCLFLQQRPIHPAHPNQPHDDRYPIAYTTSRCLTPGPLHQMPVYSNFLLNPLDFFVTTSRTTPGTLATTTCRTVSSSLNSIRRQAPRPTRLSWRHCPRQPQRVRPGGESFGASAPVESGAAGFEISGSCCLRSLRRHLGTSGTTLEFPLSRLGSFAASVEIPVSRAHRDRGSAGNLGRFDSILRRRRPFL